MPDPNQGFWRHERTSPLDPRGPNDFHLSFSDLGQGFYGWPAHDPLPVLHANKLFDQAYSIATGGWNPNVEEQFSSWGPNYNVMFAGMAPSNPLVGYDYNTPLTTWFGQEFTNEGHVPDSSVSFPSYAYSVLPDIWKGLGFESKYTDEYVDQLGAARDQARRDMKFNYLRRGLTGDAVDQYIRQQVNRVYNQNVDNIPTEGIDDWLTSEASADYGQYQSTFDANPLPTLSASPSGNYTQQRANPEVQAMWAAPIEPTTALANQHHDLGPGDPDLSGLNLGDVFASIINKYPAAAQRRRLTNPPAVPEDVLDAEISTYFNLETTPQQSDHRGKVVKNV